MNLRISLPVPLLAAITLISTAAHGGVAQDVTAYDAILADVRQGQKTIALGDMIVPVATVRLWRDRLANAKKPVAEFASQTGITQWTGGNVVYAFNANVSAAHQAAFLDGAREWETFANVHFIPRTSEPNYIMVNDGGPGLSGGNSALGMIGGAQQFNIGSSSWNRGTIVHELGHALGLIHEHQRGDRDTFVTIRAAVAGDGNFILIPTSTNTGAYDFLSVMHYARDTFAPAGMDNITPKPAYIQFIDIMGNNPDRLLSRSDRDGIAVMYGAGPAISTVVTNTQDSGAGSLRAAIYKAFDIVTDTPAATPTITFQIPNTDPNFSGGVFTIQPSDRMTAPGSGTTIDATTQTTFGGDTNPGGPEVVLNGALQNDPSTYGLGLRLSAANVTVKGLVINGFSTQGVLITAGATGNTIAGCYIGTNAAGTAAVPNSFSGIEINGGAMGNTIGGTTVAARNVISGNSDQGVFIRGAGTTGNIVRGNYLGVDAAGTGALANGFSGVEIGESASANTIGGTAAGAGNVLSGNTYQGIYINASGSNMVAGNLIGTNAAGTAAITNGAAGVQIAGGSQSNTIGGTTVAARNVISGNAYQGVVIYGTGTGNNVVAGNHVGLNAAGTAAIPNVYGGVAIYGAAADNTIGGAAAGAGNVLSGNAAQGVLISDAGTTGNVVAGNRIGTNPAGTAAIPNAYSGVGIFSGATANTIGMGNLISGNNNQGIYIGDSGTNSNVVAGNIIGLDATGTAALPNGFSGVEIGNGAQNNVIGGTSAAMRNVISGNTYQGVYVNGPGTSGNQISGNHIGTNPAGNAAIANGADGVEIYNDAPANTVGGASPGAGNVISGNANRNVLIIAANNNVVSGNLIGLNAAGTGGFAGGGPGIQIWGGSQGNTIGGTSGGRNFIAGNNGAGITISDGTTSGNMVIGNSIGVSPNGTTISNSAEGIVLFGDAHDNTLGGSAAGAANLISGNAYAGIAIYNSSTGNRISGNSITGNGGLGIDMWADGVTANDPGDADTGPNNLQNFPVLNSAVLGAGTTISWTLNSTANSTFRVEFFANAGADGEGRIFIGADTVSTVGSGNPAVTPITTTLPAIVPAGQFITATATDSAGNTSEFSLHKIVTTTDTDSDDLPDAYEVAHWPDITTTTGAADSDGDGMTNAQEFRAGTDPRNPTSVFRLGIPVIAGGEVTLSLATIAGRTYRVEFADTLDLPGQWRILADQIPGAASPIPLVDPGAAALPRRFYRASVEP